MRKTSEREGVTWQWPSEERREVKIAPTFERRYPQAAALARELGVSVSYACKVYHAYHQFFASQQLTGYQTWRTDDGAVVALSDEEKKVLPLRVLREIKEAQATEGSIADRFRAALERLRKVKYRHGFIAEGYLPNGDSFGFWLPFTMFIASITLHDYGRCEAGGKNLEECVAFLEAEAAKLEGKAA